MLTNAWPMIQTIATLVAIFANGSRENRMMRTKQIVSSDEQQQHEERRRRARAPRR